MCGELLCFSKQLLVPHWALMEKAASSRCRICAVQAGLMRGWQYHPRSQTLLSTLFNINAQAQVDWLTVGTTKGHLGGERDPRGENHTTETHLHKNGSMLISTQEQGMVSSNLVITSGWRTPSFPMLWPRAKISAHRPGKNAGPEKQRKINVSPGKNVSRHLTLKAH